MIGYANYLIFMFMNINENIRNKMKMVEKLNVVPIKLQIAQLLNALVYQTWYLINAKKQYSYLKVGCEKHLI